MTDIERWQQKVRRLCWREIVWWNHKDLCRLGIDHLNLLACAGLPGTESMDISYCLKKIDEWIAIVKSYTTQSIGKYYADPGRFGHSIGYFKARCLVAALQLKCGVRYNPEKRHREALLNVADSFIFGIIQGGGGTCASLPVLYCAVGHGLGYPMSLVHTDGGNAGHSYVCWDDGDVRFNIEASGEGMSTPTDEHYRTGQYQMTPAKESYGQFLKPKNMRHSLAGFIAERALYCFDVKAYGGAIESMGWAAALHPENKTYLNTAFRFCREWSQNIDVRKPPKFPSVFVTRIEKRRFAPTVSVEIELALCELESQECLLGSADLDQSLWTPLRRGETPTPLPIVAEAEIDANGGKTIRFKFADSKTEAVTSPAERKRQNV
jgi:hypothetical protein